MAVDTDNDLCSRKRSRERKTIDNHALVILLDIIYEQWEAVADKKVARTTLLTAIERN